MALRERFSPTRARRPLGAIPLTIAAICLCVWPIASCRAKQSEMRDRDVTISFVGWGSGSTMETKRLKGFLEEFTAKTGIQVNYIVGPESADDRLALYQQWFGRRSETPDVLLVDTVWPGLLANDFTDLNPYLSVETQGILPRAIQDDTVNGKLVAMPFNLQIGVLYYRSDLLKTYGYSHPPRTWEELSTMAARIQQGERAKGNKEFWGFVWQGAPYEGLTCNALEWQASYRGGDILEKSGVVSVDNPQTIKALKMAKSWIGTISPPSVLTFMEEDGRSIWDKGDAAFRRDWTWRGTPFGKLQVAGSGTTAIALLPQDGMEATVRGGESFAISAYSKYPRQSAELIRYLTSRDVQFRLWQQESLLPVVREFYDDPTHFDLLPELKELRLALTDGGVARPSVVAGKHYPEVSRTYYTAVHSALAGETSIEQAMSSLQKDLTKITGLPPGEPTLNGDIHN